MARRVQKTTLHTTHYACHYAGRVVSVQGMYKDILVFIAILYLHCNLTLNQMQNTLKDNETSQTTYRLTEQAHIYKYRIVSLGLLLVSQMQCF